jgi:folate-binding Fe-S cluster repair protein YgfZ
MKSLFKVIYFNLQQVKRFMNTSNKEIEYSKKYNALFKLNSRNVVSITGEDALSFLQGMITNDMKELNNEKVAISSLFLTPKGRIMFDAIIVKSLL